MGWNPKIEEDFKVGDERCSGTIVEIHIERRNNYAVVKCGKCGKLTKSIYNRLKENYACSCQKTDKMVENAKIRADKLNNSVEVGEIISNRLVESLTTNKHGKTAVTVRCLNEDCPKPVVTLSLSELLTRRSKCNFCCTRGPLYDAFHNRKSQALEKSIFIDRNAWEVLCEFPPLRSVMRIRAKTCCVCGKTGKLSNAHIIPFSVGLKMWGLSPYFLNDYSNLVAACLHPCNKKCEIDNRTIAEKLLNLGVEMLPDYVSDEIKNLFEEVKIKGSTRLPD